MSEWRVTTLAELSTDITYGYTESANLEKVGPKFLRITDIAGGRLNWDSVPYCPISVEDFAKYKLFPGDIVVARTGATTGSNYTMKECDPKDVVFASYLIRYKVDRTIADPIFIGQILQTPYWQEYVDAIAGGSAQPGANAKQIGSFEILLPPLPEQKAISGVLSSLDDKIDLLHRQNKTLEAMAEALFRQWFVVPCKNGLPKGWREDSLLELIELVGGGTPKTANAEYWDGDIPWLAGGDIASSHKSFVLNSEKRITELGLNYSSAKLLPKYSTVISARGTVGKYCILAKPMAFSQSNYGILPRKQNCFFFSYLLINHVVEELQSAAYGSVFDTITKNTFRDIKITIPTEKVISNFESQVAVYFKKVFLNIEQINLLQKLRDTLLPKLMSGEVRVTV